MWGGGDGLDMRSGGGGISDVETEPRGSQFKLFAHCRKRRILLDAWVPVAVLTP